MKFTHLDKVVKIWIIVISKLLVSLVLIKSMVKSMDVDWQFQMPIYVSGDYLKSNLMVNHITHFPKIDTNQLELYLYNNIA